VSGDLDRVRSDLEARLRRELADPDLRLGRIAPVPAGHSGFTYWVDVGGVDQVLRLPPPGARPVRASDVARQGRIMAAVRAAALPAPAIVSMSQEPVVDGRPYVLMERVEGERIEVAGLVIPAGDIAERAMEVLQRLHSLPLEATGIGNEEPVPIREEMVRWALLMQRGAPDLTERGPELGGLISEHIPDDVSPGLVHGDYSFGNLLFRGIEVAAVLDWEIASIGQPLLDVGSMAAMVVRDRLGQEIVPGRRLDVDFDAVLRSYGVDRARADWYIAFSLYKYGAILSYNVMLDRRGRRPDAFYAQEKTHAVIRGMIDEGIAVIGGRSSCF
jgi:aminoglycoside phosphotransferase (APT) family kinase protein